MNNSEVLSYAIENDIINLDTIRQQIELNERKKYLEAHEWKIWQSETDAKWYTYVPDEMADRGRRLIRRTSQKSLEDAIIDFYKAEDKEPYIKDVFESWLGDKCRFGEIEKSTADRYRTDFDRFFKDSILYATKIRYISEDMLEEFIKSNIYDKHLTSKAWGNLRVLINGIFRYAKKKGYTNLSITNFMGDLMLSNKAFTKNRKSDDEDVFTSEEVKRISSYITYDEPNILSYGILIAFQTGLRAGELSALKWEDINEKYIDVNKTEIRYKDENGSYVFEYRESTKTDAGMRKLIILPQTYELFQKIKTEFPSNSEYVFMKDGKHIRSKLFSVRLYRICDKLNIPRRSLHKARKTYATSLLDNNVPETIIKSQLGHTDILTTKRYYYRNNKSDDEVVSFLKNAFLGKSVL